MSVKEYETIADSMLRSQIGSSSQLHRRKRSNEQSGSAPSTPPPVPENGDDSTSVILIVSTPPHPIDSIFYHEIQGYQNSQVGTIHHTLSTPKGTRIHKLFGVCVCVYMREV